MHQEHIMCYLYIYQNFLPLLPHLSAKSWQPLISAPWFHTRQFSFQPFSSSLQKYHGTTFVGSRTRQPPFQHKGEIKLFQVVNITYLSIIISTASGISFKRGYLFSNKVDERFFVFSMKSLRNFLVIWMASSILTRLLLGFEASSNAVVLIYDSDSLTC